jgi:hypothetical protein
MIIDSMKKYFTRGNGKKAKEFLGAIDDTGITILIGKTSKSKYTLIVTANIIFF